VFTMHKYACLMSSTRKKVHLRYSQARFTLQNEEKDWDYGDLWKKTNIKIATWSYSKTFISANRISQITTGSAEVHQNEDYHHFKNYW